MDAEPLQRSSFSRGSVVGAGYRPSYTAAGLSALGMHDEVLDESINFSEHPTDLPSFSERELKTSNHKSMVDIFLSDDRDMNDSFSSVVNMQLSVSETSKEKIQKFALVVCMIVVFILIFITVPKDGFFWQEHHEGVVVKPTEAPTVAATNPPTAPPTKAPEETIAVAEETTRQAPQPPPAATQTRLQAIRHFVVDSKVSISESFDVQLSPHSQAVQWLAEVDKAELEIPGYNGEDDDSNIEKQTTQLLQRYALACLYFTLQEAFVGRRLGEPKSKREPTDLETNNRYEFDKTWLQEKSVCLWFGVVCNRHHQVISLNLTYTLLEGTLVPEICSSLALPQLKKLDLSYNDFAGHLPALNELASANTVLQHLDLRHNHLTSSIDGVPHHLQALTYLDLTSNRLGGPLPDTTWSLMTELVTLKLGGNNLHGPLPSGMGALTTLEWFQLDGNALASTIPAQWSTLTNLQTLKLSHNQIRGNVPAFLGDFSRLEHVSLQDNQLEGDVPASLGNLNKLEDMHLQMNHLAGTMPDEVCQLADGKKLTLLTADCSTPKLDCPCCTRCF